jgi:hypothetical protein
MFDIIPVHRICRNGLPDSHVDHVLRYIGYPEIWLEAIYPGQRPIETNWGFLTFSPGTMLRMSVVGFSLMVELLLVQYHHDNRGKI